jgi:hypothetical protein
MSEGSTMSKTMVRMVCSFALVSVVAVGAAALLTSPSVEAAGPGGQPCGGIAGLQCPGQHQVCIDDPRDNCDPKQGGADCIGICRGPGAGT